MSASEPGRSGHAADRAWLVGECVALLHGPAEARRAAGNTLGAWAAASGVHLQDLVAAVLEAAAGVWDRMAPGAAGSPAQVRREGAELLECTRSALASALDGYARRNRAELERYDDDRADFLNDLLTGRAEPGALAERAHRYGIRLSATHVVMVARAAGLTADIAHRVDAALAARFGDGNTLTTLRGGELVCISAGGLRGVGAELAHQLLTVLGTGKWQLAVGRGHPGLRGLATSLDEARGTLEHAEKLGFTAPVLNAADLLVFPVLLRDREAIVDLVTTVLGPLREARGGTRPYLDTLAVLFDNQGNHSATARQMHLSVRAVTYRLGRIQALTGYHPGEPTQRFTLQAAVLGARLLGWPDDQP